MTGGAGMAVGPDSLAEGPATLGVLRAAKAAPGTWAFCASCSSSDDVPAPFGALEGPQIPTAGCSAQRTPRTRAPARAAPTCVLLTVILIPIVSSSDSRVQPRTSWKELETEFVLFRGEGFPRSGARLALESPQGMRTEGRAGSPLRRSASLPEQSIPRRTFSRLL